MPLTSHIKFCLEDGKGKKWKSYNENPQIHIKMLGKEKRLQWILTFGGKRRSMKRLTFVDLSVISP